MTDCSFVTACMTSNTILWFRNDLRLHDHPALSAAAKRGTVVPVFIWAPEEEHPWAPGSATKWWLHRSLASLEQELDRIGLRLIIRLGPTLPALQSLAIKTGADAVMWSRRYEPAIIARDRQLKHALQASGLRAESFNGSLLFEPWEIQTQAGRSQSSVLPAQAYEAPGNHPYKVFTAFWRACMQRGFAGSPLRVPTVAPWPAQKKLSSLTVADLGLLPRIPWDKGFPVEWEPGTAGAHAALETFVRGGLPQYHTERDRPDHAGTSRLSPALHFGEVSPRTIWHRVMNAQRATEDGTAEEQTEPYLKQIVWREFAHHLLYHFPRSPESPLRPEFERFAWQTDQIALKAWQCGQTGYPIVDAGMRQLWTTGWMHNRVRMIVGSFLVKDLRIDWRAGAEWFWDTLVDADLANNTLGWQWIAGCGADAAPYFRVFNPVRQGEKFDPDGVYVRRWLPELAGLPVKFIHQPWTAPEQVLKSAGVELGSNYPKPLVDHQAARIAALEAHRALRIP